jgi:hypothetical protein
MSKVLRGTRGRVERYNPPFPYRPLGLSITGVLDYKTLPALSQSSTFELVLFTLGLVGSHAKHSISGRVLGWLLFNPNAHGYPANSIPTYP